MLHGRGGLGAGAVSHPARAPTLPDTTDSDHHAEFRGVWIATVDNIDWPSSQD